MSKQTGKKKRYKAWYYSLAVCVVACFVVAFGAFGSTPAGDATSDIVSTKSRVEQEVAAKAQNVPDSRDSTKEPTQTTTPQTSEPTEVLASEAPRFSENVPFESSFVLPVGTKISRDYSDGQFVYSETNGDYRIHNGVDFEADAGTPVKAIISGEVVAILKSSTYGTVVEVNHGNNLIARYCGISKVAVEQGTVLTQGQKIGEVSTIPTEGDSPHLHFETLIDGEAQDPLAVMGKAK